MFASYVPRNAFAAWHDPSYDVIGQMLGGSGSWNFQEKRTLQKGHPSRTPRKNLCAMEKESSYFKRKQRSINCSDFLQRIRYTEDFLQKIVQNHVFQ